MQRTQLYKRHSGGIVHHDVKYDPVANHEVPVSRLQKIFQVMLNVPETERDIFNRTECYDTLMVCILRLGGE